jgi:hypothetical protein
MVRKLLLNAGLMALFLSLLLIFILEDSSKWII